MYFVFFWFIPVAKGSCNLTMCVLLELRYMIDQEIKQISSDRVNLGMDPINCVAMIKFSYNIWLVIIGQFKNEKVQQFF